MHVLLSPELERLVVDKGESGMYPSADEVIGEALQLLHERDQRRQARQDELRREIRVGLEQFASGQHSTYDDQTLAQLAAEIKAEGRQKRAGARDDGVG